MRTLASYELLHRSKWILFFFQCWCLIWENNPNAIILTGKVQEEEEKEAQETWQEKEKEGSISFRLWLWLKDAALKSTRLSSCSTDHTQAGDVRVSKAAVHFNEIKRGTCPSLLPTSGHILHCFITLLDDCFAEKKTSRLMWYLSFSSPLTFETLAWTSRSVCRPSLELASTSDLTSAFLTARWGSYARVMHEDLKSRQPHIEVWFVPQSRIYTGNKCSFLNCYTPV